MKNIDYRKMILLILLVVIMLLASFILDPIVDYVARFYHPYSLYAIYVPGLIRSVYVALFIRLIILIFRFEIKDKPLINIYALSAFILFLLPYFFPILFTVVAINVNMHLFFIAVSFMCIFKL